MTADADSGTPPTCAVCGTPHVLHHKFNGGNPLWLWLPECECEDDGSSA